jgi:hypothetical protein
MSILFPKVPKPREWDYRPIYYDKDKEARKERRAARLHRGSFREAHENNTFNRKKQEKKSKLLFWVALLVLLLFVAYYLL